MTASKKQEKYRNMNAQARLVISLIFLEKTRNNSLLSKILIIPVPRKDKIMQSQFVKTCARRSEAMTDFFWRKYC